MKNFRVVLISPLYGGNIGSVCRAMMNMGLSDLAIVSPRKDIDWGEARKMALHAKTILNNRREYSSAAAAIADCGLVAAASARIGFYRDHAKSPRDLAPLLLQAAHDAPVALMFGPEDKGLNNDNLSLATHILRIPSTDEYASLNLAQAVMVCCYEVYTASGQFEPAEERHPEAASELRERMFEMWRGALRDVGFMTDEKSDHMMMGLRRILSRGKLTTADVKILMGMARQTQWAANEVNKLRDQQSNASEES